MAKRIHQSSSINNKINVRPLSSMDEIKFCGYLRKKRNKVGGWRKLWFVLRERLLVSYSSKEEYDNKLVSFKDVLNLVPGTQVRPLDGLRFTIETTTQIIYTFHCDDQAVYREWISTLLESLGGRTVATIPYSSSHRFRHISMDDIPNTLRIQAAAANDAEQNFTSAPSEKNKKKFARNVNKLNCSQEDLRTTNSTSNKHWPKQTKVTSQALKKQIERMSITGTKEYRHAILPGLLEEHTHSKVVSSRTTKETITRPLCRPHASDENIAKSRKGPEPVYAVVDLKNKYAQRKLRSASMDVRRCSSYESIFQNEADEERSANNQIEVIYEDGDLYYDRRVGEQLCDDKAGEENIYEPINVGQQTSMFALRKYIERLKFKPFLRTPKAQNQRCDANITYYTKSRFSSIRWKFGVHRRSMQKRMRKFCFEPGPLFRYHGKESADPTLGPPPPPLPVAIKPLNSKTTITADSCNRIWKPPSTEPKNNSKKHNKLLGKGVMQRFEGLTHFKKSLLGTNIENSLQK